MTTYRRAILLALVLLLAPALRCMAADRSADLFAAVAKKDATAIKSLVQAGADPNGKNADGSTPLHLAVEGGDPKTVKALVEAGADIATRNAQGFSPAFIAAVVKQDLGLCAILMQVPDTWAKATPYPLIDFGNDPPNPYNFTDTATLVQSNPFFGYRFLASPDWRFYKLQQDGFSMQSNVVLQLPGIFSDLEKQKIENAVSVYAAEKKTVRSLEDALQDFKETSPEIRNAKETKDATSVTVDYEQVDGRCTYKRRAVILFQNGFTYQIGFTATPGTFDKNLELFNAFAKSVKFTKPERLGEKK